MKEPGAKREAAAETVVAPDGLLVPSRDPEPLVERRQSGEAIGAGGMGGCASSKTNGSAATSP